MDRQTTSSGKQGESVDRRVVYGITVSEHQRETIQQRAASLGKSASEYLLELVEKDSLPVRMTRRLTGKELMALPKEERHRRFDEQAKKAAYYYATDPDLDFRADDPIIEY